MRRPSPTIADHGPNSLKMCICVTNIHIELTPLNGLVPVTGQGKKKRHEDLDGAPFDCSARPPNSRGQGLKPGITNTRQHLRAEYIQKAQGKTCFGDSTSSCSCVATSSVYSVQALQFASARSPSHRSVCDPRYL